MNRALGENIKVEVYTKSTIEVHESKCLHMYKYERSEKAMVHAIKS